MELYYYKCINIYIYISYIYIYYIYYNTPIINVVFNIYIYIVIT